mgnify:FL=1
MVEYLDSPERYFVWTISLLSAMDVKVAVS